MNYIIPYNPNKDALPLIIMSDGSIFDFSTNEFKGRVAEIGSRYKILARLEINRNGGETAVEARENKVLCLDCET